MRALTRNPGVVCTSFMCSPTVGERDWSVVEPACGSISALLLQRGRERVDDSALCRLPAAGHAKVSVDTGGQGLKLRGWRHPVEAPCLMPRVRETAPASRFRAAGARAFLNAPVQAAEQDERRAGPLVRVRPCVMRAGARLAARASDDGRSVGQRGRLTLADHVQPSPRSGPRVSVCPLLSAVPGGPGGLHGVPGVPGVLGRPGGAGAPGDAGSRPERRFGRRCRGPGPHTLSPARDG